MSPWILVPVLVLACLAATSALAEWLCRQYAMQLRRSRLPYCYGYARDDHREDPFDQPDCHDRADG